MNWVEYKLEDDSVIKVPYNRCNVAPVTKKVLEQLINTFNESIHQAKILEHIKTNYAERLLEQYEKGKADGAREFAVWLAHWIGYSKEWAELELESYEKEQKGAEK